MSDLNDKLPFVKKLTNMVVPEKVEHKKHENENRKPSLPSIQNSTFNHPPPTDMAPEIPKTVQNQKQLEQLKKQDRVLHLPKVLKVNEKKPQPNDSLDPNDDKKNPTILVHKTENAKKSDLTWKTKIKDFFTRKPSRNNVNQKPGTIGTF